jgi:hypothetical protein
LHHLHHELALPFGHPYGALGETSRHGLRGEVRASFTLFGFKISKSSDRFASHVDADILRRSIGVAHERCHAAGVEDAIKITTCRFGSVGELVAGCLDLVAGIVCLLQTFCSFVRFLEQHGVALCSGG